MNNSKKTEDFNRLTDEEIAELKREAAEDMRKIKKMPPIFPNFPKKQNVQF